MGTIYLVIDMTQPGLEPPTSQYQGWIRHTTRPLSGCCYLCVLPGEWPANQSEIVFFKKYS